MFLLLFVWVCYFFLFSESGVGATLPDDVDARDRTFVLIRHAAPPRGFRGASTSYKGVHGDDVRVGGRDTTRDDHRTGGLGCNVLVFLDANDVYGYARGPPGTDGGTIYNEMDLPRTFIVPLIVSVVNTEVSRVYGVP